MGKSAEVSLEQPEVQIWPLKNAAFAFTNASKDLIMDLKHMHEKEGI